MSIGLRQWTQSSCGCITPSGGAALVMATSCSAESPGRPRMAAEGEMWEGHWEASASR